MYAGDYEPIILEGTLNRVTGKISVKSPVDIIYARQSAKKFFKNEST